MNKRVGIVVLNYNAREDLLKCLNSLKEVEYNNFEAAVVDNASEDGSADAVRKHHSWCTLIENETNLGFSKGNNVGIRYFLSKEVDHILLLNNDTVVESDFLDPLVNRIESDKKIAAVGPKVLYMENKDRIYSAGENNNLWFMYYPSTKGKKDREKYNTPREIDNIVGCAMLISRKALEDVGLLDTKIYPYFEEVDWCIRAKKKGCKLFYEPDSVIYHKGGAFWGDSLNPEIAYHKTRNLLLLMRKHANPLQFLAFIPQFSVVSFYRIISSVLKGETDTALSILKGIKWNLKPFSELHS